MKVFGSVVYAHIPDSERKKVGQEGRKVTICWILQEFQGLQTDEKTQKTQKILRRCDESNFDLGNVKSETEALISTRNQQTGREATNR